ncbi:MAG: hypothetical protein NTZ26_04205 [Candidatus Aminicenantes bacterium]|nr:hypothetical protein [Candidatus Aminicenantes bacterium]
MLSWFPEAFVGPDQKRVLVQLAGLPEIEEHFFLTGGTALARREGIDTPGMIKPIEMTDFWKFYEELAGRLYRRGAKSF